MSTLQYTLTMSHNSWSFEILEQNFRKLLQVDLWITGIFPPSFYSLMIRTRKFSTGLLLCCPETPNDDPGLKRPMMSCSCSIICQGASTLLLIIHFYRDEEKAWQISSTHPWLALHCVNTSTHLMDSEMSHDEVLKLIAFPQNLWRTGI